jgi:uncharacterized membrane protein YdbT with pleckstrin-like domain
VSKIATQRSALKSVGPQHLRVIPKVWRSEIARIVSFLGLCIGSVVFYYLYPSTVINGKLFSAFGHTVYLQLPLAWLAPAAALLEALARIYNVSYRLDQRGVEAHIGVVSVCQSIIRIRFEDIRSIESRQSLIGRMLDFGSVELGTASSGDVEVVLEGVDNPREVREYLQTERDTRLKALRKRVQQARHPEALVVNS